MGVSKNRGAPKWMVKTMETPIKMDDLGVSLFSEPSKSIRNFRFAIRILVFKKIISKTDGQFRVGLREEATDEPTWSNWITWNFNQDHVTWSIFWETQVGCNPPWVGGLVVLWSDEILVTPPKFNDWNLNMMMSKKDATHFPGVDFQVNHVKLQGCNY